MDNNELEFEVSTLQKRISLELEQSFRDEIQDESFTFCEKNASRENECNEKTMEETLKVNHPFSYSGVPLQFRIVS